MNPTTPTKADAKVAADNKAAEAPINKFAVAKEFWLNDKLCVEGSKVDLTDSQAKRLGDKVKAA
jgi:hypothetical protein